MDGKVIRSDPQFYKLLISFSASVERHFGLGDKIETLHGTNLQWLRRAEGTRDGRHFPDLFLN